MLVVKHINSILGHFFCVSFNPEPWKDPSIYDMSSEKCSYTTASVVRSVGRVRCFEKLWKLKAFYAVKYPENCCILIYMQM